MFENFSLDYLLETVKNLDTIWIYVIIFFSGYLENCIPPIPGDTVTVFAAYMVGIGRLNYFLVFATATAGNLSGFMTMYQIGRHFGKDFFFKRNFKFFPKESIEKTETWFNKYGYRIILFNRFMSGLRSVISIFAGMAHLKRRKIIPLALLSACMWDGVLIYGGYLLGDNWQYFDSILQRYNTIVVTVLILVIAVVVIKRLMARYKTKTKANRNNADE
ncbi:DedA family protein [bacterium]|nr:DedA family protein [bacterium]